MNIQQLRGRYSEPVIPKCSVCGAELTVQRAGGGPTIWGCTGMIDDPTGERNWVYAEGRECADEHYERSRWSDYRQGGDADVIELIDALEAAERERDDLKQRLANAEHQLHMAELAKFNLRNQRKAQFRKRREAEAELARRDAAAGEPDYWQFKSVNGDWIGISESAMRQAASEGVEVRPLYTAVPPALLPPAMTYAEALKVCDWKNDQASIWVEGANWMLQRAKELGARQQKPVQLPWGEWGVFGEADLLAALDAANVKWEVRKLVPIDATRLMIDAAKAVEEDGYDAMLKAMLEAAPAPGGDHDA